MLSNEFYRSRLLETCFRGSIFEQLFKFWPAGNYITWLLEQFGKVRF